MQPLPTPFACLLSLSLFGASALAAPLNVVETIDFAEGVRDEFPSTNVTNVGTLDIGLNQVSGNIFETDSDAIQVGLPAGLQIDTVDLVITNHVDSPFIATAVLWATFLADGSSSIDLDADGGVFAVLTGPLAIPGDYNFQATHNGGIPQASSDWEWRIVVSEVPEPTSLALLATVGLVGLLRRR